MAQGKVARVNGPLVVAEGMKDAQMFEVVEVGEPRLVGEITRIEGDRAYIQVYEDTSGIRPGEPVFGSGAPLSVELGPGLLGQLFDGLLRPLGEIKEITKSPFI
ncbi:MAG: V-type ATP synthase subunit A, partial [Metallosphaera sp.]